MTATGIGQPKPPRLASNRATNLESFLILHSSVCSSWQCRGAVRSFLAPYLGCDPTDRPTTNTTANATVVLAGRPRALSERRVQRISISDDDDCCDVNERDENHVLSARAHPVTTPGVSRGRKKETASLHALGS